MILPSFFPVLILLHVHTIVFAEKDYYEILGVDRSATKDEIRKAFNTLSLKYHPDKVRDDQKQEANARFEAITSAYEVLSDDEQRRIYDFGGEDALKNQMDMGGSPFDSDPFEQFFRTVHEETFKDTIIPLYLSLEELFTGKQIETVITRRVICQGCKGNGASQRGMRVCHKCGGSGFITIQQQIAFGIFSTQMTCDQCHGQGKTIAEKCSVCGGCGTVSSSSSLSFLVPPGTDNYTDFIFADKGDEFPKGGKSRLVVRVIEKKMKRENIPTSSPSPSSSTDPSSHQNIQRRNQLLTSPLFTRDKKNNLYSNITISLADSITGNEFILPHFLNHSIQISRSHQPTPPGTTVEIKNEGMPLKSSTFSSSSSSFFSRSSPSLKWFEGKGWKNQKRGSLFVSFNVEYPQKITKEQEELIKKALY